MTAFDPQHPTCSYTHVWLRVMHEQLDPTEISGLLGIEPTKVQLAGDRIYDTSELTYKYSGWSLQSKGHVQSRDSRDHFAWLLERISGKGNVLQSLASRGYLVDICCRWDSASGHGGPTMDPEQLVQLGSLGVEVWFDIYFDGRGLAGAEQFIQAGAASRHGPN